MVAAIVARPNQRVLTLFNGVGQPLTTGLTMVLEPAPATTCTQSRWRGTRCFAGLPLGRCRLQYREHTLIRQYPPIQRHFRGLTHRLVSRGVINWADLRSPAFVQCLSKSGNAGGTHLDDARIEVITTMVGLLATIARSARDSH